MWQRRGWDRIKGARGPQREGGEAVIDENPELQALGGGQDTSLHHSHTRTHTSLSAANSWEHPRHPLIPDTTQKSLMGRLKTSIPVHVYSPTDPRLTPVHVYVTSREEEEPSKRYGHHDNNDDDDDDTSTSLWWHRISAFLPQMVSRANYWNKKTYFKDIVK